MRCQTLGACPPLDWPPLLGLPGACKVLAGASSGGGALSCGPHNLRHYRCRRTGGHTDSPVLPEQGYGTARLRQDGARADSDALGGGLKAVRQAACSLLRLPGSVLRRLGRL